MVANIKTHVKCVWYSAKHMVLDKCQLPVYMNYCHFHSEGTYRFRVTIPGDISGTSYGME
jgi:predicted RNA-binding protein with PUA domain